MPAFLRVVSSRCCVRSQPDAAKTTVEVEKELTGWQSFKMKMGGWFLGILIILIVFAILYIVKFLKP